MTLYVDKTEKGFPVLLMEHDGKRYPLRVTDRNDKRAWAKYFELVRLIEGDKE